MDNLAHTLCGVALARARLLPRGPLVTTTLVVAANAPDVDALLYVFGDSTDALMHRRGWTHALFTCLFQVPLLALLFLGLGRWRARRGGEAPRWHPLLLASGLGYLSHLGLDLLNTYGVRVLLPFDERWIRGDMAFIVDPWMWLLFGGATLFGGGVNRWGHAMWWSLLGLGVLGMSARGVPTPAMALWAGAMGAGSLIRTRRAPSPLVARALLAVLVLYLAGLKAGSVVARERGLAAVARQLGTELVATSTVSPTPAVPWRSQVVVATPTTIFRVRIDLLEEPAHDASFFSLERHLDDPLLPGLIETREYRAWRRFARHPFVRRHGDVLVLGDGRYSFGGPGGWMNFTLPLARREPAASE